MTFLPEFDIYNVAIASLVAFVFLFGIIWGKRIGAEEERQKRKEELK